MRGDDATKVQYKIGKPDRDMPVEGFRVGDFAVRFSPFTRAYDSETGEPKSIPPSWVVDHILTGTSMAMPNEEFAWFFADEFAQALDGHTTVSTLVAAFKPMREWVQIILLTRSRSRISYRAWLRQQQQENADGPE